MIIFSLTKLIRRDYQPRRAHINKWLRESLIHSYKNVYIDISIVSSETSQAINLQFRKKNKPTNIISLEYANTRDDFAILSGELILCDEIIVAEAQMQQKNILDHYAHMIVHGVLHLQGMDHIKEDAARQMESLENKILNNLGINSPYIILMDKK